MAFKIKLHRLKIVEQIAIVFFFAVLIPMSISGFIINNINQQAVRAQLRASAVMIANTVSDEIDFYSLNVNDRVRQLAFSLKYFKSDWQRKVYLKAVMKDFNSCEKFEFAKNNNELARISNQNITRHKATVYAKMQDGRYLVATYDTEALKKQLFRSLKDDKRQIYVLEDNGKLIAQHNYKEKDFEKTMLLLPKKMKTDEAEIFGDIKNQPLVYIKKDNPKITIIVNTTEKVTNKTINSNRFKIILSILAAVSVIFAVMALYIFYLYINMRQLFKGVIAITKGNYQRQVRLLTTAFTPHEIVFTANEFNKMASEIHKSYLQLKKNNKELKELNEFRSNLIDTVSHELRTPLTSIQGYTSRLMRQDIEIDEATKQKSLRIIKEQSERLKQLIEDLLTIPDIEGMRLRTVMESVWIPEVLEDARLLIRNKNNTEFVFNIDESFPRIMADKNRLVQVFVNLLENASKYADEGTKVVVDAVCDDKKAKIFVQNQCPIIPEDKLQKLFGKFIRMDNNTTRTTRGTGLGLFIVKGLVEAMHGEIKLKSTKECGFTVEVTFMLDNGAQD
ncbi:MAG: HAMP domain-containing histidine kinase [Clostridiaceae bacterium]|jgi:signal transduction histidine kinase|nr:HAMP domain-containing histidine kinase [Clostridiaceae bacterium]